MRQEEGEGGSGGVVEWWSGGSKRRPGKSTGLFGISYANFCRGDAEEESGLGGNSCLPEHREVFSYLAPGS